MVKRVRCVAAACLAGLVMSLAAGAWAADAKPAAPAPAGKPQPAAKADAGEDDLAAQQQKLAAEYKELEAILFRMAPVTKAIDPRKAQLMEQALREAAQRGIKSRLDETVAALKKEQLRKAIENQSKLNEDLKALLDVLMTDSEKRTKSEKERIRKLIGDINRIWKEQNDLKNRTEGGDEPGQLKPKQGDLAGRTGELAKQAGGDSGKEGKPGDQAGKPGSKEGKGDGKEGKPDQPGKQGGQEGQEGEGQSGDPSQSQDQNQDPVQKALEKAKQRMKAAEEKLAKANAKGAVPEQKEALKELDAAREALEDILRQLREEEMARLLQMLIERYNKILQQQRIVYDGTVLADKVPEANRTHSHEIECGRLSGKELAIVSDTNKVLDLLREEGSAVAMTEATLQVRDDMQQVAQRLAQSKVDKEITQQIELDILKSLGEMIDALKKEQKKLEDKKNKPKPGQPQQGPPQDPPLIDILAELKMVRSLQVRVNDRTKRYGGMITGGGEQADKADLVEAVRRLADYQQRIYRVTRDLEMGKNQ